MCSSVGEPRQVSDAGGDDHSQDLDSHSGEGHEQSGHLDRLAVPHAGCAASQEGMLRAAKCLLVGHLS